MPRFTTFTKVGLQSAQGLPLRATALPVQEYIGRAITQLPITHCSFGNIYKKCYASGEDPDYGSSYPSLTGLEG